MYRWPFLSVIVFMGLSILTAFAFHRWQESPNLPKSPTTAPQKTLTDQVSEAFERGERVRQARAKNTLLEFEEVEDCEPARLTLNRELSLFPPIFREPRTRAPADFPRACLVSVMKQQKSGPHQGFAQCADAQGTATLGSARPCITETYVNVMYNLYGDVTSCLGLPQREILPRLLSGSGFHLNWMGPGSQIGIARLNETVIAAANFQFENYKQRVLSSDAEACKRLQPYLRDLEPVRLDPKKPLSASCALLMPPANPLRNLFYMAIQYEAVTADVERSLASYQITELLSRAGLQTYEPEQLRQTLVTIGLTMGAEPAVIALKNYLQSRIDQIQQKQVAALSRADFDFSQGLGSVRARSLATDRQAPSTFPGYLGQHLSPEDRASLEALAAQVRTLNSLFKEGTCVAESYLSLSL